MAVCGGSWTKLCVIAMKKKPVTPPALTAILDEIQATNKRIQAARKAGVAEVGIFWVVDGKLIYDGTPWTEGVGRGQYKTYPTSNAQLWTSLQRLGAVPRGKKHEGYARGRVAYNTAAEQFAIFADHCVLTDQTILEQVIRELRLPTPVKIGRDDAYRCPRCSGMKQ